jgi:glycosyltransferase involved in cell wall biosynthesis
MVSEKEKEYVKNLAPRANVVVVPNGVDTTFFQFPQYQLGNNPPYLLFLGSLSYFPNRDAVIYFHKNIWPILKLNIPTLQWIICGREPPPEIEALAAEDITITGWVEDVRPFMYDSLAMIVPLRCGSGTRIKILEAMSAGLPVVSTTFGAEGLSLSNGKQIMISDTPEQFSENITRLYNQPDLAQSIRVNGRRLVEEQYDWKFIAADLNKAYSSLFTS